MRTPTPLSLLFTETVPPLVTLLAESIVTTVMLLAEGTMIEPADVISTSDAVFPVPAVEVLIGAVVAVAMDTCAKAGRANTNGAAAPSSRRTFNDMRAVNSRTYRTRLPDPEGRADGQAPPPGPVVCLACREARSYPGHVVETHCLKALST